MGHGWEGKKECLGSKKVRDEFLVSVCTLYKTASELQAVSDLLGFHRVPSLGALGPECPGDWQGLVHIPRGSPIPSQAMSGLQADTVVLWR